MLDEIRQSVDVNALSKPVGLDRFLGKQVILDPGWCSQKPGTVESVWIEDNHPVFLVLTEDGHCIKAFLGQLTFMQ